jgi:putative ABC transport system substrate-binding protein
MSTRNWVIVAVVAVVAVIIIGAFFVDCGDSTETTTTTAAPSDESTTTTEAADESTTTTEAAMESITIGVTQIVSHPALDAVVEGFKEQLAEEGWVEGENVTYDLQNAQGDMANASAIAQKFASENLDLVLSIATPTSQAAVNEVKDTPVLFAAVTDPVAAELVADPNAPSANVTGVSDLLPIQPHVDLIQSIVPDVKTIGLLYNSGEANSVALIESEKEAAAAMGIETVEATAASSGEVLAAAQSLVGRVDAISVLTDNTIVSAFESVVKVCNENGIPLIAGDTDSVQRGAVAAYAFNYKEHGRQAGRMALKILSGMPIAQIPVEYAENLELSINTTAATAQGVTLPQDIIDNADNTFQ